MIVLLQLMIGKWIVLISTMKKMQILPRNKFSVYYSKRCTARCIVCKKAIRKGEIGIGKSVLYKATHIVQYHGKRVLMPSNLL